MRRGPITRPRSRIQHPLAPTRRRRIALVAASARAGGTRRRTRTRCASGHDAETAPAGGRGTVAPCELALRPRRCASRSRRASPASPTAARPMRRSGSPRGRVAKYASASASSTTSTAPSIAHLHAGRTQAAPVEQQRRARVGLQLAALAAVAGGCRRRSRARRRPSAAPCAPRAGRPASRWPRHRGGFEFAVPRLGLVEQCGERGQGFGVQIGHGDSGHGAMRGRGVARHALLSPR